MFQLNSIYSIFSVCLLSLIVSLKTGQWSVCSIFCSLSIIVVLFICLVSQNLSVTILLEAGNAVSIAVCRELLHRLDSALALFSFPKTICSFWLLATFTFTANRRLLSVAKLITIIYKSLINLFGVLFGFSWFNTLNWLRLRLRYFHLFFIKAKKHKQKWKLLKNYD